MDTHTGGCHCKDVRYEARFTLGDVLECNCSHCQIKGLLLVFIPATDFTLLSGEDALTEYRFNKKIINHLFCKKCGVQSFSRGEKDGTPMVAINVRALDDIDLSRLNRIPFDGKQW